MKKIMVYIFPGLGKFQVNSKNFKSLFNAFSDCEVAVFEYLNIYKSDEEVIDEDIYNWVSEATNNILKLKYDEIILVGISFGVWLCLLTAQKIGKCHCVFIGSAVSLNIGVKESKGIAYQYAFEEKEEYKINDLIVNKKFMESLIRYQPMFFIETLKDIQSALILYGKKDNINRKIDSIYLLTTLKFIGVEAKLKQYQLGRHMLNNNEVEDELLLDINKWRKIYGLK